MKVIIPHPEKVERIKNEMKKEGFSNLHILSDFDRTLTYGTINNVKTPSIISILRDGNYLVEGYSEKAHALYHKYHPIEVDSKISLKEKVKAMDEWWDLHNKLLIESSLSKKDLKEIVETGHVKFRKGVPEFLDYIKKYNIPLIIFSASGCGDAVQLFFEKINKNYSNIFYITNKFNYDEKGIVISPQLPIIHCMNKTELVLKEFPEVYEKIKDKLNVILLGDSLDDSGMAEGFEYKNILKIGFLNLEYNKDSKKEYLEKYDILLEGDGDFTFVYDLIKELK
jgi:cytosolic 5'-nucleotidase 3